MKHWTRMSSPIGDLLLVEENGALLRLAFETNAVQLPNDARENRAPFRDMMRQLDEYFAGRRHDFDLPLSPQGTAFQKKVWNALLMVKYGSTASYSDIAKSIDNPKGVRAVGLANGRNPIPVIIPCHRVIGSNGTLTGYGGGLAIKRKLLDFEGAKYKR